MNPITQLFNVGDGSGLTLSDYQLVFTNTAWMRNPIGAIFGDLFAGPIYIVIVTLFAPAMWVVDFITNPDQLAGMLTSIGGGILGSAFRIVSPIALGTIGLMFLAFRFMVLPKFGGAGKGDNVRFLGKTGFSYESTVMRGNLKDKDRKGAVDKIGAGFILLIVVALFTMRPFMVVQKLLEFTQMIVASMTNEQGNVTSPMFAVLRGVTWLINFGSAVPESCVPAWSQSMESGRPGPIHDCLPAEQAAAMSPSAVTVLIAILGLVIMWFVFQFNWAFLKQATWFLAVVIWRSIFIPYLALRSLFRPTKDEAVIKDVLSIFSVILTYFFYFILIVFLASLLPSVLVSVLSEVNAHPIIQIAVLGAAYWAMAKYVIPNIKPGSELFGTTMPGSAEKHTGWSEWRKGYWEDENGRPAQAFTKMGMNGKAFSPAWSKEMRAKSAKKQKEREEEQAKMKADKAEAVDKATERVTVGSPVGAHKGAPKKMEMGTGTSDPAVAAPAKKSSASAPAKAAAKAVATAAANGATGGPLTVGAAAGAGAAMAVVASSAQKSTQPAAAVAATSSAAAAPASAPVPAAAAALAARSGPAKTEAEQVTILGQNVTLPAPTSTPTPILATTGTPGSEAIAIEEGTPASNGSAPTSAPARDTKMSLIERQESIAAKMVAADRQARDNAMGQSNLTDARAPIGNSPASNNSGRINLHEVKERWSRGERTSAIGDAPGVPSAAPTTITDDSAPPESFVADVAAELDQAGAMLRAESNGEMVEVVLSRELEEQVEFSHDPREPEGQLRFNRQSGFGDRI